MIKYLILIIPFLFIGCSTKQEQKPEFHVVTLQNKSEYTSLEEKIIEISKENTRKYNEYIEILTEMKQKTKLYNNTKIPKRMARRVTFVYDGPALKLLKMIAEETLYHLDISNTRILDSKNISRKYEDSMLIDIIYDIVDTSLLTINIDERTETITIMDK